ncbi:GTPase-activating protein BEM2/IPL2 [Neolecta irregularis DAH-3]|uniref:GTPase-activating protein BEM2/IPL2 n=1 Tax=Neolecta irregularis (strain DAH-3) TaxID=1198029 RepID=A0A1U7LS54_NEOID|nr:GTPase-activating protein BEM2/IPL2 [Neolecta irregularis DAH-3]|eukprot:OLL25413.1 GTPase-activating protein BEM2/IPL2 [Neolecta irregularis DAH-3]
MRGSFSRHPQQQQQQQQQQQPMHSPTATAATTPPAPAPADAAVHSPRMHNAISALLSRARRLPQKSPPNPPSRPAAAPLDISNTPPPSTVFKSISRSMNDLAYLTRCTPSPPSSSSSPLHPTIDEYAKWPSIPAISVWGPEDRRRQHVPSVVHQGWLYKKPDGSSKRVGFHKWKQQWVVLRDSKLMIYNAGEDGGLKTSKSMLFNPTMSSSESSLLGLLEPVNFDPTIRGLLFDDEGAKFSYADTFVEIGAPPTATERGNASVFFLGNRLIVCKHRRTHRRLGSIQSMGSAEDDTASDDDMQRWRLDSIYQVNQIEVLLDPLLDQAGNSKTVVVIEKKGTKRWLVPSSKASGERFSDQHAFQRENHTLGARPSTAPAQFSEISRKSMLSTFRHAHTFRHPDLKFDDQGNVFCGTVEAVCHELLFGPGSTSDSSGIFVTAAKTIGFWAPTDVVLNALTAYAGVSNCTSRLQDLLRIWVDCCPGLTIEDQNLTALITLINEGVGKYDAATADYWKDVISESRNALQSIPLSPIASPIDNCGLDFANILLDGLTPHAILEIPVDAFSEQLHLFHYKCLHIWDPSIDLSVFFSSGTRNPLLFASNEPHFITTVVLDHILVSCQSPSSFEERRRVLSQWIGIGLTSKRRGDLVGWLAIVMAVCSPSVLRLQDTWGSIDPSLRNRVCKNWAPVLYDMNRLARDLKEASDSPNDTLSAHVLAPDSSDEDSDYLDFVVPFFGDLREAVRSVEPQFDGKENIIAKDVDLTNCRRVLNAVEDALARWTEFVGKSTKTNRPFNADAIPSLQACLKTCSTTNTSLSNVSPPNYVKLSFICEPRLRGNYVQHHYAQRRLFVTGAFVPLVFTDIIPSHKLFERVDLLEVTGVVQRKTSVSNLQVRATMDHPRSPRSNSVFGERPRTMSTLRRNNSYPPSQPSSFTTGHRDLDRVTRSRIAGLKCRNLSMLKSMRDIAGVEEFLYQTIDGELVLKTTSDEGIKSRPTSLIEISSKRMSTSSKRSSVLAPNGLLNPRSPSEFMIHGDIPSTAAFADVVTKAGSLERLVDLLVLGVEEFESQIQVVFGSDMQRSVPHLQMDLEIYTATFLATYRSFCSPVLLLEFLRKRLIGAKHAAAHIASRQREDGKRDENFPEWSFVDAADDVVEKIDWQLVSKIQLGVLEVILSWISDYYFDFLDHPDLRETFSSFLRTSMAQLQDWKHLSKEKIDLILAKEHFELLVDKITKEYVKTSYQPTFRSAIELPETPITRSYIPIPQFRDFATLNTLLNNMDEVVSTVYRSARQDDWMITFEIFENQSIDPLGFYPRKQPHVISDDDTVIQDIFIHLSNLHHAQSEKQLLEALPSPMRKLHQLHFNIKTWVINRITETVVDQRDRISRIQTFLMLLAISKKRMSSMDFYPLSTRLPQNSDQLRFSVPSFVGNAISAALVSPESRMFASAWYFAVGNDQQGRVADTLTEVLPLVSDNAPITKELLVPCVGWTLERMLEIACYVPDMSIENTRLVNFDKRRYVFNLVNNLIRQENALPVKSLEMNPLRFLLSDTKLLDKTARKLIREIAYKELQAARASKLHKPFGALIFAEQEKLRRDFRHREAVERCIRDQKRKRSEPGKLIETFGPRISSGRRLGVNSILKAVRPISVAISSNFNPSQERSESENSAVSHFPTSTESIPSVTINLSGAVITPSKKDSSFRIKTDNGSDFWFQATSADEFDDWKRVLAEVTADSLAQAALAEEWRIRKQSKKGNLLFYGRFLRNQVFGVDLDELCERDGQDIPIAVEILLNEIERRGLKELGLYRVPGSVNSINAMKTAFDSGIPVDLDDDKYADINVIAGTLKGWLRDLPESLLTDALYDRFICAISMKNFDERLYALRDLIHELPRRNFEVLRRFTQHLEKVTMHEDQNQMFPHNLAIVFGPSLLRNRNDSLSVSMGNLGYSQSVVKELILQCEWIFTPDPEMVTPNENTPPQTSAGPESNPDQLFPMDDHSRSSSDTSDRNTVSFSSLTTNNTSP